jgi:ABC-type transport system involved in multi-copper enzyme maturation permease subunit
MYFNLLAAERTKIFKRSIVWVILASIAAIALIGNVAQVLTMPENRTSPEALATIQQITWPEALAVLPRLGSGAGMGALLVIILVGTVAGQEYRWRSLHLWLSEGFSRRSLLAAKFLILILTAFLIVLTPLLIGGAHSLFLTPQFNGTLNLAQIDALQVVWNVLRGVYSLFPYIALTLLLAVATRSTVVPVAGGMAYLLIIEALVPQVLAMLGESWARIGLYLPQGLASVLTGINRTTASLDPQVLSQLPYSPAAAAAGIAAWTILYLGLALWIFRRQDLSS